MIDFNGWGRYNIWEHSPTVLELYTRRALGEAEEMTCAAQAAELLQSLARPGESLLDVGCGTGYFLHSIRSRNIPLEYFGVDATERFIEIGREALARFGLPRERLQAGRIEDLDGRMDHVLCMNVLSNIDNFHRPLERLLRMARKSVILRESVKDGAEYRYVEDRYLESPDILHVHVNAYDRKELTDFMRSYGYSVREIVDRRTGGAPEMVIDHPHYWTFFVATRIDGN
jgi:ubiquinone/menaquinone biosynthesis C-methylase UbiE